MASLTKFTKIGLSSGFKIPVIGFGVYKTSKDEAGPLTYDALMAGYRHIDSAQFYNNEQEVSEGIAKWLSEDESRKREDVFYTTKVAHVGYDITKRSVIESLEKAKSIDYIDLLLIHSPFGTKAERLGSWKAMQEFVEDGSVKSIGVSNYGIHHIQELFDFDELKIKPVLNQIELNPWLCRKELVDFCFANGIEVEAYSPLTRGHRINDPEIVAMGKKYNKSPAQILIRWCLQRGYIPLPKTANPARVSENLDVFDFEISAEDMKSLSHEDQYYVTNPQWDPTTYMG
ncbi:NADP-dependent oxidoreductase domain-containing protein [Dipodascopsis uninucleata]